MHVCIFIQRNWTKRNVWNWFIQSCHFILNEWEWGENEDVDEEGVVDEEEEEVVDEEEDDEKEEVVDEEEEEEVVDEEEEEERETNWKYPVQGKEVVPCEDWVRRWWSSEVEWVRWVRLGLHRNRTVQAVKGPLRSMTKDRLRVLTRRLINNNKAFINSSIN